MAELRVLGQWHPCNQAPAPAQHLQSSWGGLSTFPVGGAASPAQPPPVGLARCALCGSGHVPCLTRHQLRSPPEKGFLSPSSEMGYKSPLLVIFIECYDSVTVQKQHN